MSSSTDEQIAGNPGQSFFDYFTGVLSDLGFEVVGDPSDPIDLNGPEQGTLFDSAAKQCDGCDECRCSITGYKIPEVPSYRTTGLESPLASGHPIGVVINQRLRSIIEFGIDDDNALDAIDLLRDLGEI